MTVALKYSADQERDAHGRWSGGSLDDAISHYSAAHPDTRISGMHVCKEPDGQQAIQQLGRLQDQFPAVKIHEMTPLAGIGAVAQYHVGRGVERQYDTPYIYLEAAHWGAGGIDLTTKTPGFHFPGTNNPDGYITHEFGHAVDETLSEPYGSAGRNLLGMFSANFAGDEWPTTGYGKASASEKFADLFAGAYASGSEVKDSDWAVRFRGIMDTAFASHKLAKYSDTEAVATVTKVSGLAFADAARAILRQGYAAAYLAGKKLPARTATAPPAAKKKKPIPETVTPPDEYDRYADDQDWYGDLDDDGQDAVDDSSDGLNDRLLGLGALLLGGAVSAAMLDAWMGTYANSLNPLFEVGFQAGVNGLGEVQQVTWHSEDDPATCDDCKMLDGMTWVGDEIDAAMPHPGDSEFGGRTACGPNCFAPGTLVSGRFVTGMRARYVGELVELRSVRGHHLTVTPNHPVATPAGFVPAGSLREGDYVLSQPVAVEAADGLNVEDRPAAVEQVLEALERRPTAYTGTWKPRGIDLHGDAEFIDGDVYVVGTDRRLLSHGKAASPEGLREFRFVTPDVGIRAALGEGSVSSVAGSLGMSRSGRPGSPEQVGGRLIAGGPSSAHTRAAVADSDAVVTEQPIDGGTWLLVGISEYLPGDATFVETDDGIGGQPIVGTIPVGPDAAQYVGSAAKVDACLAEPAGNSIDADAEFIRELGGRFPGLVSPDQIVEVVRREDFVTHVYDLGTEGGWLIAGGILAGNCRCSLDYEYLPADQATYSMGGYDDTTEAMSTADLLKIWAITAKYELTDMPTSHILTLRSILAKPDP